MLEARRNATLIVLSLLLACAPEPNSAPPPAADTDREFWRSALYPEDWGPDFEDEEGRFLHDFSWSGYRNSEAPLPSEKAEGWSAFRVRVDADREGKEDATAVIQAAIDEVGAQGGGVVFIPEGLYRLDGLLEIQHSGTILQGEGPERSRLWFTRVTGMSDKAHITFRGNLAVSEHVDLVEDGQSRGRELRVADAGALEVGDSVSVGWLISEDFVERHGMSGVWKSFNGKWQTFFRRQITDIDRSSFPHRVTLDVPLRYEARVTDQAALKVEEGYLSECGLVQLGLANAGDYDAAWEEVRSHVLAFIQSADCFVHEVRSFAPPTEDGAAAGSADSKGESEAFHLQNGGIRILQSKRLTLDSLRLENAQNRGEGGCGYLFEVSQSSEVLIRDSVGRNGRHNFIQNWGFGTSGLVFLRIHSEGGTSMTAKNGLSGTGFSEFHHSLAMANLIDSARLDDGFHALNRKHWSSGAGHSATESVFWNARGKGLIESHQFGHGYVIGTQDLVVNDSLLSSLYAEGADPVDFLEGIGAGDSLEPSSLFEDQLARRLSRVQQLSRIQQGGE